MRVSILLMGIIMYQTVQWSYAFDGNVVVESVGIFCMFMSLMPQRDKS